MKVTRCSAITLSRWCGSRSPPGRRTTRRAPVTRGRKISLMEMSKDSGALNRDASSWPKPRISRDCHNRRSLMASWRIIAPLGRPVEPEVKMTYASASAATATAGGAVGRPAKAQSSRSTRTASGSPGACSPEPLSWSTIRASSTTTARRASGHSGSSGTNAHPAWRTPSRPMTISAERPRDIPTTCSAVRPRPTRWWANWALRSAAWRYVRVRCSSTIATASGRSRACSRNSSTIVGRSRSAPVSFQRARASIRAA